MLTLRWVVVTCYTYNAFNWTNATLFVTYHISESNRTSIITTMYFWSVLLRCDDVLFTVLVAVVSGCAFIVVGECRF